MDLATFHLLVVKLKCWAKENFILAVCSVKIFCCIEEGVVTRHGAVNIHLSVWVNFGVVSEKSFPNVKGDEQFCHCYFAALVF